MNKEHLVELPREEITFYGDTENERKANEQLFDMSLELSSLYDENDELHKEIDRLNNIINELEEFIINKDCWLVEVESNNYKPFINVSDVLDKLKELKDSDSNE